MNTPTSKRSGRCRAFPARLILTAALAVAALPLSAQETFEERADRILDNLTSVEVPAPGGSGKIPYGRAVAALAKGEGDLSAAKTFLVETGYGGGDFMFNALQKARGLYVAEDILSASELESIKQQAMSVDFDWNNNGTENHRKMTWSSGYLFAQMFPDGQWKFKGQTVDSATLMQGLKERLAEVIHNEYRAGYSEFLSPNYEIYSVAALINLYDYAADPEVRALAEAGLVHRFSLMALGSFEEVVLPPWSRYAGVQNATATGANIQLLTWLFWGHGNLPSSHDFDPTNPIYFFSISDWRPPEILERISQREVAYPYTAKMQQTHWQWNPERYNMRTTYQDELFAVSSGAYRFVAGAFQLDDAQFAIAWDGSATYRQIHAYHPYWRQEVDDLDDWTRPTSPFMQTAQHEDTAIQLYDIPAEDPWAGVGQWARERTGPMVPLAQMRFPAHMDYTSGADNWIFVADGPVYIAIKVLKDGWRRDRRALVGWNVIKSQGTDGQRWQTGFIYEVGTEAEFGSLEAFQTAVEANPVSIDWETMTVSYTNTNGDELDMTYAPFPEGGTTFYEALPDFSVNGERVHYDETWPVMQSPWTRLQNNVLLLELNEEETWVSDFSGELPEIQVVAGQVEAPSITEAPADASVDVGGSVTLSVVATGTEPLSYQWYKDDEPLSGAEQADLTITGVVLSDAGEYSVEVSNPFGSVMSDAITLTVNEDQEPDTWAGYPIDDLGFVNTGDFLGWIYPSGDYIYVYYFGRYIFLPESYVGDQGAWSYVGQ